MLIVETATNSHYATVNREGVATGMACDTTKLPKRHKLIDSDELRTLTVNRVVDGEWTYVTVTQPRGTNVACNRCTGAHRARLG